MGMLIARNRRLALEKGLSAESKDKAVEVVEKIAKEPKKGEILANTGKPKSSGEATNKPKKISKK